MWRFFTGGAIRHTAVIPIAGDQITNDIAMALRTPDQGCRRYQDQIRLRTAPTGRRCPIEVPGVGERGARMFIAPDLAEVIEPRVGRTGIR